MTFEPLHASGRPRHSRPCVAPSRHGGTHVRRRRRRASTFRDSCPPIRWPVPNVTTWKSWSGHFDSNPFRQAASDDGEVEDAMIAAERIRVRASATARAAARR
jgi:hypothetical protein